MELKKESEENLLINRFKNLRGTSVKPEITSTTCIERKINTIHDVRLVIDIFIVII